MTTVPRCPQNSALVTTGQWCLIPDVPALGWSSSHVPRPPQTIREGGARLAWTRPTRQAPTLTLCSRLASSASILSSSFYPSEKAEETSERSIQPSEKPGVGEGATYLLPSISKVWGRAQRNGTREPSGASPHPPRQPAHHHYTQHWRHWGSRKEEAFHHLP